MRATNSILICINLTYSVKGNPCLDLSLVVSLTSTKIHAGIKMDLFYNHIISDDFDNIFILLLQILYEAQNAKLCQVLVQSINNHSLCLVRKSQSLSLFDWLCLSYCINNSNTTWNHLHLETEGNQDLSLLTSGLTNNSLQCKRLEIELGRPTDELIHKLLLPSLLYNMQECYCHLSGEDYVPCNTLLQFINLPQLKILHLKLIVSTIDDICYTDKCTELEKCIEMNSTYKK